MTIAEVIEALPSLTFEERQLLIRRALETLVEQRLAAHQADPTE